MVGYGKGPNFLSGVMHAVRGYVQTVSGVKTS